MNQIRLWVFWIGPYLKDLRLWIKCLLDILGKTKLQGSFAVDKISYKPRGYGQDKMSTSQIYRWMDSYIYIFIIHINNTCQGSPIPGSQIGTGPLPVRNRATQQDASSRASEQSFICIYSHSLLLALPPELHFYQVSGSIIDVMCLNHPQTIPPCHLMENIIFYETVPWCQKGWGPLTHSHGRMIKNETKKGNFIH